MSPGKAAAQAVHAAMMLEGNYSGMFASAYKRTVIVLEAENAEALRNLNEYLTGADIFSEYYIDEGMNEVSPFSITALAVEPIEADDDEKRDILGQFGLFTGEGNKYSEALRYLERVSSGFRGYGGPSTHDATPRFMRKTLEWLRKRTNDVQ